MDHDSAWSIAKKVSRSKRWTRFGKLGAGVISQRLPVVSHVSKRNGCVACNWNEISVTMERIRALGLIIDLNAFRELSCGYMMSPTAGMVVEVESGN